MISQQNTRSGTATMVAVLLGFTILAGLSCRRQRSESGPAVDSGDEGVATEKIAEADRLYAKREDLAQARLGLAYLRQASVADYGNYEAAWKVSRLAYYLGAHTSDERERDDAFREGIESGKTAVQLQPAKPDGHFWLGANYGGSAEHSALAGLANFEDIRHEMETVLKLDEGYEGGSAYLGLGQLYLQAPRVLGGNTQKAIEYLEKGLRVGSNNSTLRLKLAEAYHAAKRDADARKQIDFILKMTADPNHLPEHNEAVKDAQKLRDEIGA